MRYSWHVRKMSPVLLLAFLLLGMGRLPSVEALAPWPGDAVTAETAGALGRAPVMFVENVGQLDRAVRFQARGGAGTLWLAEDALWITLFEAGDEGAERQGVDLRLSFPGANPDPRLEPFNRLETTVSYFVGDDPDRWRSDAPVWGGVRYVDLYPGIDLEVTGEGGRWALRLRVRPGADLSQVRLRVAGAESVDLVEGEGLRLHTAVGDYALPLLRVQDLPKGTIGRASVQELDSQIFDVTAPFALSAPSAPGQDNPFQLLYGAYLGGDADDYGGDVAVDGHGAAYVVGRTGSSDFPTTPGAFDVTYNGGSVYGGDVFVVKINPDGTLAYAAFLGGSEGDYGYGIAVDGYGAAYVTGGTDSPDFPVTPGAFDSTWNSSGDAFVVKVSPGGDALVYATFLGGSGHERGNGIAVDGNGAAYVTGETLSSNFPTTAGAFDGTYNGGSIYGGDAFVVKVASNGSALAYSTFLGGHRDDSGSGIAVDGSGAAYVTGSTLSDNFPTTPGAFDTTYGGGYYSGDAFVVKVTPNGGALAYSTFLGGYRDDSGSGIAVDGSGAAYVAGTTASSDFPTTPGSFDPTYNGGYEDPEDAFVVKVAPDGSTLLYGAFLGGGDSYDVGRGIAVNDEGAAYVVGYTSSTDFPTTPDAFDTTYNYNSDAFVAKVSPGGSELTYATFLGGGNLDDGMGIAVDGSGAACVVGYTTSEDFPTTPGSFAPTYNGGFDAFVVKLDPGAEAPTYAVSGRVQGAGGHAIPAVTVWVGESVSITTDLAGAYAVTGLISDAYTLDPVMPGWIFTPPTRTVSLPPDAAGQDFTMLHPPVSITLSLSGTANLPNTLAYVDTQGLTTTLTFPRGAVTATTRILLTPTLPAASAELAFAGHAFDLAAYQEGVRQPDLTFDEPVTVAIHYSAHDVRVISDEGQLALHRWADGTWADGACEAYERDLVDGSLAAPICRVGHFALFGPTNRVYLPLVLRQS